MQLLALHAEVHPEETWTHPWDTNPKAAAEMKEEFLQAKKEFDSAFDPSAARTSAVTPNPLNGAPTVTAPAEQEQGEDNDLIEIELQGYALCCLSKILLRPSFMTEKNVV